MTKQTYQQLSSNRNPDKYTELTCNFCNELFYRLTTDIIKWKKKNPNQKHYFCGHKCAFEYKRKDNTNTDLFQVLVCSYCKHIFQDYKHKKKYKKSGKRYCTKECALKGMSNHTIEKCLTCKKEYKVYESRRQNRRKGEQGYCSRNCYKKGVKAHQILTCSQCKKPFKAYNSQIEKTVDKKNLYCSRKCYDSQRASEKIPKECALCGKKKLVPKYELKKHITGIWHCSIKCLKEDKAKRVFTLTCTTCKKSFRKNLHKIEQNRSGHFFCSQQCAKKFFVGKNNPMYHKHSPSCHGWRKDIDHYCRSTWEANYCRILKYLGIEYTHEPQTFELPESSYTPDIRIGNKLIEIKGYMHIRGLLKIISFKKFYKSDLIIINQHHYESLEHHYHSKIKNWEYGRDNKLLH